ncbi:MAG: hypothetical protein J7L66_03100 [Anaerolineaceae bacterium]|nr:hypothetical protein [Anaerolineaceae bacterium]
MNGKRIGKVSHYFNRINVAAITLSAPIKIGDRIHFLGRGSDFVQDITSMEIDHKKIEKASKSQEIALKTIKPVKKGTSVFVIIE